MLLATAAYHNEHGRPMQMLSMPAYQHPQPPPTLPMPAPYSANLLGAPATASSASFPSPPPTAASFASPPAGADLSFSSPPAGAQAKLPPGIQAPPLEKNKAPIQIQFGTADMTPAPAPSPFRFGNVTSSPPFSFGNGNRTPAPTPPPQPIQSPPFILGSAHGVQQSAGKRPKTGSPMHT